MKITLTPQEEKYLDYSFKKGFIKTQNSVNSTKTQLQQGKTKFSKKDKMLMELLTLPTHSQAFALLEQEREFFKQDN